jgi:hypothetical protein
MNTKRSERHQPFSSQSYSPSPVGRFFQTLSSGAMREQFPWFLDPTEEELQRLWDEATFCFDANVLLNLYRVDEQTTEDYFKIFRAFGDRIFLPHEAANQFFHNRRDVIRTEQNSFSKAKDEVEKWKEERLGFGAINRMLSGDTVGNIIEDEIETVFEDREDYEEEVEAVKNDLIDRIEDLEERFTPTGTTRANAEEDEILEELMDIFEGKTGDALDGNMEQLKEEARERYEEEKPPGYEDYDDENGLSRGECEDFLIWKQLIEFAEREGEDVVFITGEKKEDWWEVYGDHNLVRPSHELLREFYRKTSQSFWMLTTERMVQEAGDRLELDVKDNSVRQTERVAKENEVYRREEELGKVEKIKDISNRMLWRFEDLLNAIESGSWEKSNEILNGVVISMNKLDKYNASYNTGYDIEKEGIIKDHIYNIRNAITQENNNVGTKETKRALRQARDIQGDIEKKRKSLAHGVENTK